MIKINLNKRISRDSKKIALLKDKYKNERCFIIGNGPSLRMEDLDLLHKHNEFCFGANSIIYAFPKTVWRPSVYTISDELALYYWYKEVKQMKPKYKFISCSAFDRMGLPMIKDCIVYNRVGNNLRPVCPDFSSDVSEYISEFFTVTFANMQIAAYLGFKEIYLLGIDFKYSHERNEEGNVVETDVKNYFSETATTLSKSGRPQMHNQLKSYMKAEVYANMHGFNIYNATRGGNLDVFRRTNFDEISF